MMKRRLIVRLATIPLIAVWSAVAQAGPPPKAPQVPPELAADIQVSQPGAKLTLLAEHPALVTPTGIDVDRQGQIWVVACHTHFRPEGYQGPEHDEILVFDRHGKNRRVFYNRTQATMQVKIGPDGWVYLAERDRILRVRDTDQDGIGDEVQELARLESGADYPHNALSGMAWHPGGDLMFTLGENYSAAWKLVGADGRNFGGTGEGGVFRCRPDGSQLRRVARGFWNPFGLLVRDDGEMFACENDPGSRPPCRLLNIVEGADYGYQRAYGNASVHPFVAWNGELRGTLGMVHPCGEGPCAILELGGGVLIPSWSNHRIDYFPLTRHGAGYKSERIELLHGSDFFRPTCMARGPDGAFYLNDWVYSSYELHGRGRLWKLEIDRERATWIKPGRDPWNDAARLAGDLRQGTKDLPDARLFELAGGSDPYLSDAALTALARRAASWSPDRVLGLGVRERLWTLVALRRTDMQNEKWVRLLWSDPDPQIRFECLRWIADARLVSFRADVQQMLSQADLDYPLFEAVLATWNTLRGKPEAGVTDIAVLLDRVSDPSTPPRLKGYALRLIPPTHPKLSVRRLQELLAIDDPTLSTEVVRTLAARDADDARAALAAIADDGSRPAEMRADAVVGLAGSIAQRSLLLKLASDGQRTIRQEALRALRTATLDSEARSALRQAARRFPDSAALAEAVLEPQATGAGRPPLDQVADWLDRLAALPGAPDRAAGRRIFFHSKVALCSTCHRREGRGNVVGPDLSLVAQQGDRKAILQSILEPNRDVAPQFYPTQLLLADGTTFTGILLRSSKREVFRDITGKERTFDKGDIVEHAELKTSLMPTGLVATLTDQELRDLLAYLTQP